MLGSPKTHDRRVLEYAGPATPSTMILVDNGILVEHKERQVVVAEGLHFYGIAMG
jgi:hypothetical protein